MLLEIDSAGHLWTWLTSAYGRVSSECLIARVYAVCAAVCVVGRLAVGGGVGGAVVLVNC